MLVLASVPLYRIILERRDDAAETPPVQQPSPVAVARVPFDSVYHGAVAVVTRVECRQGILIEHGEGWERPVVHGDRLARCDIRAEPVRPQSSEASD